jgi:hypothetical protein
MYFTGATKLYQSSRGEKLEYDPIAELVNSFINIRFYLGEYDRYCSISIIICADFLDYETG